MNLLLATMVELHTHTLFSDGQLAPAELARRAQVKGIQALAITDHVDASLVDLIVPRLVETADSIGGRGGIKVIAGAELTHCPVEQVGELVEKVRRLGAKLVLMHGETLVEPVRPGTNRAAIEAGVDVLAHPGLICREDAARAAEIGVCLEISGRKGHCLSNGYVAKIAREVGAKLVFGADAHGPEDLYDYQSARQVLLGAGLSPEEAASAFAQARELLGLM